MSNIPNDWWCSFITTIVRTIVQTRSSTYVVKSCRHTIMLKLLQLTIMISSFIFHSIVIWNQTRMYCMLSIAAVTDITKLLHCTVQCKCKLNSKGKRVDGKMSISVIFLTEILKIYAHLKNWLKHAFCMTFHLLPS